MDYSKLYFNKTLDALEYQDIVNFFTEPKEESTKIEFKSFSETHGIFNDNLDGIIRGICAFLNSEGGILIWGAPKGKQSAGQSSKSFMGDLSPVTELKTKDWLINKISDAITPLPVGIEVATLQNGSNVIYVFEVQQSNYSPHQFKDKYYARLDGQTKPAPHYLIDALFKRVHYPNIEGYIRLDSVFQDAVNYCIDISIIILNTSPLQNEENITFSLRCPQGKFEGSTGIPNMPMYSEGGHTFSHDNYLNVLHYGAQITHKERIIFRQPQLKDRFQNEIDLSLSFGGKFSPLKTSNYKIKMDNVDWNNPYVTNYLISPIEENAFFHEKHANILKDRESFYRNILKR